MSHKISHVKSDRTRMGRRECCEGDDTESVNCRNEVTVAATTALPGGFTTVTEADDCMQPMVTWTSELCRQPFDAILQYAMGE